MGTEGRRQSLWQRLLEGKTTGQRLIVAVGTLAGALVAIGGMIAGIGALVGEDNTSVTSTNRTRAGEETIVTNQTRAADDFVRFLLETEGTPVQLNHKVMAPDLGSHVRLEYDCAKRTGCSFTRLEAGSFIPDRIEGGVWYRGCFSVVREGAGYGAEHLDLEFTKNGATCP